MRKCINCGEGHDGAYETWEGEVGPFCSACWELLRECGPNPAAKIYYDEDARTYVAQHTIMSAGRTREEAVLALESAVHLTAVQWPPAEQTGKAS